MILFGFITHNLTMVEGRVNFPSKGSMKGNMPLIWQIGSREVDVIGFPDEL